MTPSNRPSSPLVETKVAASLTPTRTPNVAQLMATLSPIVTSTSSARSGGTSSVNASSRENAKSVALESPVMQPSKEPANGLNSVAHVLDSPFVPSVKFGEVTNVGEEVKRDQHVNINDLTFYKPTSIKVPAGPFNP
jgi:hypothetical protein